MSLTITALSGIPLVKPGDDLAQLIAAALKQAGLTLLDGDALVVTSKIVSKAEGRYVDLASVTPGEAAQQLAAQIGKDPRLVELVLQESSRVSRTAPNTLITTHKLGFTCANAGIDQSNIGGGEERVLLLPRDPDGSAAAIRAALKAATGARRRHRDQRLAWTTVSLG